MELKDRVKQARRSAGFTQSELADAIGIKQASISELERGLSRTSGYLVAIAKACGVDPTWLATGDGDSGMSDDGAASKKQMNAVDFVRSMLAQGGKSLSKEARQRLLAAAEETSMVTSREGNVITAEFPSPAPMGDRIRIAHYDIRAAMGGGQVVQDYPEMLPDLIVSQGHLRELGVTYEDARTLKMLTGIGQSMAPTIQHLDPMIVDVSVREFRGDGIYAFVWQGLFYVKRLQMADADHFEMISDNPAYKDIQIRKDDTHIQAMVLLIWGAKKA